MKKVRTPDQQMFLHLAQHALAGVIGSMVFGVLLLVLDVAMLRSLIFTSQEPILWLVILFASLMVPFGTIAVAIGLFVIFEK